MFERFTADARRATVLAQEEARTLGHGHIGSEHLLLGVLAEGEGIGANALREHGADIEALRTSVRESAPHQAENGETASAGNHGLRGLLRRIGSAGGHIPFTARAKQSLVQALRAATEGEGSAINSGHILLGVLRVPGSSAARALDESGVDTAALRTTTERLVGRSAT